MVKRLFGVFAVKIVEYRSKIEIFITNSFPYNLSDTTTLSYVVNNDVTWGKLPCHLLGFKTNKNYCADYLVYRIQTKIGWSFNAYQTTVPVLP